MLTEAFVLTLLLPPLAFNAARPAPPHRPPRELTCPVGELGRPWHPPAAPPLWSERLPSLDPRSLRPRDREALVNPLADIFLFFALAGLASGTGGSVDLRPRSERAMEGLAPAPFYPGPLAGSPAKPRF